MPDNIIFDSYTTVISTRSRYAQFGGEFPESSNVLLATELQDKKTASVGLPFINHSEAPILLQEGDVCRLMSRVKPYISGFPLLTLMEEGLIEMGGEEEKDWWIAKGSDGIPMGVGLYITEPEEWIPPSDKPVMTAGETTRSFRVDMTQYLRPIEHTDKPTIRISQTKGTLFTASEIMAFLEEGIETREMPGTRIANRQQINAPALYGAYPATPWHIRTETLSTKDEINTSMHGKLPRKAVVATFYSVINPLSA